MKFAFKKRVTWHYKVVSDYPRKPKRHTASPMTRKIKIRYTQPDFMHTGMEQITVKITNIVVFFPLQTDFIKYTVDAFMKCTDANVQTSSVNVSGKQLFTCSATVRLGRERERNRNLDVSDLI